jgi:hypothetical protein
MQCVESFPYLPVKNTPWEDISMDFVVELLESEGFDATKVVVDRLLKMWYVTPCHPTIDAVVLARIVLQEVVCHYGLPVMIISDWGPHFACPSWGQICSQLKINQ